MTTAERKRILLTHIYGVDIDPQAVEVTKLSLLLKVLEGETDETLSSQLRLFQERALPDLADNIKCGNSLIGPDFFEGKDYNLLTEEERYRINPFDWPAEFPHVFRSSPSPRAGEAHTPSSSLVRGEGKGGGHSGGFDAVIGNPPYIRIQALREFHAGQVDYLKQRYHAGSKGNFDIYVLFVERGLDLLNGWGKVGMIVPNKFFTSQYGEPLRELILQERTLAHVVHFGDEQVFSGATTYTCLVFLDRTSVRECEVVRVDDVVAWVQQGAAVTGALPLISLGSSQWTFAVGLEGELLERLVGDYFSLGTVARAFAGTQTSADDVYVLHNCHEHGDVITGSLRLLGEQVSVERCLTKPFLFGRQIRRYTALRTDTRLLCPYQIGSDGHCLYSEDALKRLYPRAYAHLTRCKERLRARKGGHLRDHQWFAYGYPKSMHLFQYPKIVVPDYNDVASFTLDLGGHFFKTGYGIIAVNHSVELLYLLGLLNSRLLFWCMQQVGTTLRGGYIRFWTSYLTRLPIRTIDFSDADDRARHDKMVNLVQTMLDLHKQLATAKTAHDKTTLQRQITATDHQIDQLVYELYALTEEEIRIAEEATPS